MKFSMIFEAQMVDTSRKNEAQILHDSVEQAVLAEEVGFDRIWAVEHHCLKWYAHMSASETFLAFVAGKTERIRIGHGVVCLPFRMNHPVKVAERVAMLDVLSKGRCDFGIGKGGTEQESGAFQTDRDDIPAHAFSLVHRDVAADLDALARRGPLIRVTVRGLSRRIEHNASVR